MADLSIAPGRHSSSRPRRSLFVRYLVTLFTAVVIPLLLGAASEAWFGYRDRRAMLGELLHVESRAAASRIENFFDGIRDQLGWVVQSPWVPGEDERHRFDGLRLLRQVPAILSITLVDEAGVERAFISRVGLNRLGRGPDMKSDPAVVGARASRVWFSPVLFKRDSEPYVIIAIAGNMAAAGIAIAEINLKLIWDVIATIKIGESGKAFMIDNSGRLIAHPDISLVLRGAHGSPQFDPIRSAVAGSHGNAVASADADGTPVIASSVRLPGLGWSVIAQQPLREAYAPIRNALWRSLALIVVGALFSLILSFWLARRMSRPIRQLEDGAQRIGAGQFDHRIKISSGDELEHLANRFNHMAGEIMISKEKSERIDRLKRFLAPQVAELVVDSGYQTLLGGQRREVVAIFGDLRGFTAFSADAEPEIIMGVLGQYYDAVGKVVTHHQATLTGFAGDGLMILVNAPVECEEPALRGLKLAIDMQKAVQELIVGWRDAGQSIGFGVGAAMGPATVGTVGYEGRIDYTAIGSVINLASRLCGAALDTQILIDATLAKATTGIIDVKHIGERSIKGYVHPVQLFGVSTR